MRSDKDRLLDILEAIAAIEKHPKPSEKDFLADELVQVWYLRHLEIIGEAAANLSQATREQSPDIPWRQIIGMRNILIHGYFQVDWRAVWNVASHDLATLKSGVDQIAAAIDH